MRLKQAKTLRRPHRPNTNKRTKVHREGSSIKRTTFAAACVLFPAFLLSSCAPHGAASASAFGDMPPLYASLSASSPVALPAEDGSILLAEGAVTLMLSAENLPPPGEASSDASGLAERDSSISYTITNTSGLELGVILIPRLERRTDGGWEAVPCDAVFCGTADPLETERSGRFPLEWYPALTPGTYRLGLQLEDYGRGCLPEDTWVTACFTLTENTVEPSQMCAYPRASGES